MPRETRNRACKKPPPPNQCYSRPSNKGRPKCRSRSGSGTCTDSTANGTGSKYHRRQSCSPAPRPQHRDERHAQCDEHDAQSDEHDASLSSSCESFESGYNARRCGPSWRSFRKLLKKISRQLSKLNPMNFSCCTLYILGVLLLLGFLYLYGLTLLYQLYRLLRILAQTFLPASWLKTTQEIVEEALYKYSADRLGLTDYALESSGATVLCSSETYYSKFGMISVFNLPTWYHASTPSSVIQPDVQPGNCWAMNGNFGFVTIQLVMPVVVTAVTLEHIPKEISVAGRLDSAPRDFMIIGKERGLDSPDVILGSFTYKIGENPIQLFHIKDPNCLMKETPEKCGPNKLIISIVTLKILNNYGNQEYTCIYRFRVHGNPQPSA